MSYSHYATKNILRRHEGIQVGLIEIGHIAGIGMANSTHYVVKLYYDDNETKGEPTEKATTMMVLPLRDGASEPPKSSGKIMNDLRLYLKEVEAFEPMTLDNAILMKEDLSTREQVSETL